MANLVRGTAFITGAASGIGQYTAYALAKHGVNRLALCDIRPEALKDTADRLKTEHQEVEVLNVEIDTSREDSVKSAISQTVKAFDRIDIVHLIPIPSFLRSYSDLNSFV